MTRKLPENRNSKPTQRSSDEENLIDPFPEPVIIPIEPELDLHTFSPKEVGPLLEDYLQSCRENGIFEVKIIHGKGKGQLKARVKSILAKNPLILHLEDADFDSGGWGATIVQIARKHNNGGERTD